MKLLINLIIVLIVFINLNNSKEIKEWYSIDSNFNIIKGLNKNLIGWGYYKDEIHKDGWGKLYIEMNSNINKNQDTSIYYKAAGYLEGYLTWSTTWNYTQAFIENQDFESQINMTILNNFMNTNYQWMLDSFSPSSSSSSSSSSIYNQTVYNVIQQFEGFTKGYGLAADSDKQLTFETLLLLQYAGDIDDVIGYLQYEQATNKTEYSERILSLEQVEKYLATKGRCSGLVRVPPDLSELFTSHSTWGSYFSAGYRIFKHILIPDQSVPGNEIVFSSYSGVLTSDDDFFQILSTKLVAIETTNNVLNTSLYQYVTPNSLLYWVRSIVANRLSNNGQQWTENFVQYNSGTYNNQWMIVDYKLFTPFEPLQPGTLWIVEQIPGATLSEDVTNFLSLGYWPSYNRPYFRQFYDALGYNQYQEIYGIIFTYELNPRAKMFRRDANNVMSLEDMQSIMTRNNYKTDVFSGGYPGNAIASRYDLGGGPNEPFGWSYIGLHGAIDSKIASYQLIQSNQLIAKNGPTVTPDCPPFTWLDSQWENNQTHIGSPDTFNFDFILIDIKSK